MFNIPDLLFNFPGFSVHLPPDWAFKILRITQVLQRIGLVMEWAVAMGFRTTNPCGRVDLVLGRQQHRTRHFPALPHREVRRRWRRCGGLGRGRS